MSWLKSTGTISILLTFILLCICNFLLQPPNCPSWYGDTLFVITVWNDNGTNTHPVWLIRCLLSELFEPWDYHANPNNSNVQLVPTTICTIVYVVIPAGLHSWGETILVDLHLLFQYHIQGWRTLPLKQCLLWVLYSISKRGLELKRRGSKALLDMTLKLNNGSIGLKTEMESDGVKRFAFETDYLNSLFDSLCDYWLG